MTWVCVTAPKCSDYFSISKIELLCIEYLENAQNHYCDLARNWKVAFWPIFHQVQGVWCFKYSKWYVFLMKKITFQTHFFPDSQNELSYYLIILSYYLFPDRIGIYDLIRDIWSYKWYCTFPAQPLPCRLRFLLCSLQKPKPSPVLPGLAVPSSTSTTGLQGFAI